MEKQTFLNVRPNGPIRAPVTGLNETRALRNLLTLPEIVGYLDRRVLYEVSLRRQEHGWLSVAKAASPQGPKVAFINGHAWTTTFLLTGLLTEQGPLTWGPDRYPSKWYKNSYSGGLP